MENKTELKPPGPELKDADDPALYEDVNGKFPVQKMIQLAKNKQHFNLTLKGVKLAGGAKFKHQIIEPKSKGGGVLQFVVGASKWEIQLAFEDMDMDEKKEIIIHGG